MSIRLDRSVRELSEALARRDFSALELTEAALSAIEEQETTLSALITVTAEEARLAAREVDRQRHLGEKLPPLAGLPYVLKDNICTQAVRTTAASRMLSTFVPPYSAAVAERLDEQAAVLVGKANLDEFAMGSTTETSCFQTTRNPLDPNLVPGGSSGGSAAAVAAGEAVFALGSDTGGSLGQPAAFCGLVGLRPSYGLVSRRGVIAYASSLDQVGPLTRRVEDAAYVLQAIAGHDPLDATSRPGPRPDYLAGLADASLQGLTIGWPKEAYAADMEPEILEALLTLRNRLEVAGARVQEVSLASFQLALPAYYLLSSAEASSNFARFDGIHYGYRAEAEDLDALYLQTRSQGFGAEVKRRLLLGAFALSSGNFDGYYRKAQGVRRSLAAEFQQAFQQVDLLLLPVSPRLPWPLGEKVGQDPVDRYTGDLFTVPVSLGGLPSLTLPVQQRPGGAPVACQLVAPRFGEGPLLKAGQALEDLCR